MNIFERFLYFLQGEMERPKPWGWYHLLCIFIMIIFIIILYLRKNKHNEKQLKIVIGTYGIIAFILELLKQLMWSMNYDTVTKAVTWDYQWYAAPFQLCTTPIFVCLICLFLKKNKVRDYLLSFMAYITILGSISTILMPDSCFVRDILVNIHTMWLHLASFVVSIYLLMSGEVKIELKSLRRAIIVFLVFVFIALVMDIIVYNSGVLNGETFNMFFISPYFNSTLPVFSDIQPKVPYIIFLLFYIFAISIGGLIIFGFAKLTSFLHKKIKRIA